MRGSDGGGESGCLGEGFAVLFGGGIGGENGVVLFRTQTCLYREEQNNVLSYVQTRLVNDSRNKKLILEYNFFTSFFFGK